MRVVATSTRCLLRRFIGITMFVIGTLAEALAPLFGWQEVFFRGWRVAEARLGGAPLAQGTAAPRGLRSEYRRSGVASTAARVCGSWFTAFGGLTKAGRRSRSTRRIDRCPRT